MFPRPDSDRSASANELRRASQAELEDALFRFHGRFSAHLSHAFEPFASSETAAVRIRAARDHLVYEASALDIVSGPLPEANLLDMVAHLELAKAASRARWNVDTYGESGARVSAAFDAASSEIWSIARVVLRPDEEADLRRIIQDWQEENPDVVNVAAVRLAAFSAIARESASRAEARARGLLSNVRKGVMAADMARLLGERALFVAQRMPFLVRLQVRLAALEIVEETGADLPSRVATIAGAAAERVQRYVYGAIAMGAVAAAGVVVVAAIAYAKAR